MARSVMFKDTLGAEAGLLQQCCPAFAENLPDQVPGKPVVPRFHRGVRRKHASAPHRLDVRFHRNRVPAEFELFLQQSQREKCRMPFVHVVAIRVEADTCAAG